MAAHSDEYLLHLISIFNLCNNVTATARTLHQPRTTVQFQLKAAEKKFPDLINVSSDRPINQHNIKFNKPIQNERHWAVTHTSGPANRLLCGKRLQKLPRKLNPMPLF